MFELEILFKNNIKLYFQQLLKFKNYLYELVLNSFIYILNLIVNNDLHFKIIILQTSSIFTSCYTAQYKYLL